MLFRVFFFRNKKMAIFEGIRGSNGSGLRQSGLKFRIRIVVAPDRWCHYGLRKL